MAKKDFSIFLASAITKLWPLVLLGILVLSAFSIPPTIRLFKTISTDPVDLLPTNHPNVQALLQIRNKLEKSVRTAVVFESDSPKDTLRFLNDTVSLLRKQPFVGKVTDRKVGYDFFNENKMLFIELEDLKELRERIDRRIQKEKLGGLLIDLDDGDASFGDLEEKYKSQYRGESGTPYNVSANGRIYAIYVESSSDSTGLAQASQFQDAMEDFLRSLKPETYHPSMKIYFSGPTKVLEYRALIKDLKKVGIISGIFLLIPLLIRFRNPLYVFLTFLPLIVAMPISFALSSLFVPKLNVSTSFLFAILGGLGVENGIHIFSRYLEERKSGRSVFESIQQIYQYTGRSVITAVASVAATFLLLVINEFRGFSEFGIISGLGLWVIFLVYFSFLPALCILTEKIKILRVRSLTSSSLSLPLIKRSWLKPSLIGFALFSLYSFAVTPFIPFEYDSKQTRAEIPEAVEAKAKQRATTRRVNNPAVVIIHSREEADHLKEVVNQKIRQDIQSPTIDTARSYYDLVPANQDEKLAVIRDIQNLLKDKTLKLVKGESKKDLERFREALNSTKKISLNDVPQEVLELFKGKETILGELFYINAIPEMELDDGKNAIRFAEDVGNFKTSEGTYFPSSDAVIYGFVLKTMLRDSRQVLLLSLLSVTFFVFLDFRNWKKTATVMASILVGVFWMLGLLFLFRIKLNFYNMIIIPAVMGMSIDNSIHIYHRYEEMGRGSIQRVLSSTGLASLMASLTNASGFFGLLFCVHKGLYSIGLLAVIGVTTCLISTLVFLPALLQFKEDREQKKASKRLARY